jgi:hypothetical protein
MLKSDIAGWSVLGFALLCFVCMWFKELILGGICFILAISTIFVVNYYNKKEGNIGQDVPEVLQQNL